MIYIADKKMCQPKDTVQDEITILSLCLVYYLESHDDCKSKLVTRERLCQTINRILGIAK